MQAQDHDAVVLVHGIGNGEQQGDFLVDVTEPLLHWMGENGARFDERSTSSLRRGDRPSQIEVAGTLPDPAGGSGDRTFRWRLVEARWSDEFRAPPERTALGWSRRAYPESVLDHISYYDTVWRFWRLLARLPAVGGAFRWLGNGPTADADGDDFRWAYRYRVGWSLSRKAAYALWFGLVAPLVLLALATPILLPLALPWVLAGRWLEAPRWSRWERSYFNAIYRLLLVLARVPLLAIGYLLLLALTVVSAVPLAIPGVEPARRAISTAIQMQFADTYVYNLQLVQAWAIADAVERVIRDEAARCRTLTVLAYSQGTVVAYEALSRLARGAATSPIARPGLELRLITVGAALNRARGHALGGDGAVRSLLALPLPPGIRWVDIWAMHDPVPMGSIAGELCERAGVAPLEVRVSNTLTELDAHTSYWQNEIEVLSVLAEELATAPSEAAKLEPPGAPLALLQPRTRVGAPNSGFWGWRVRHGRTAKAVEHWRRQRFLFGLAALRAAGYVFTFGVLAWVALAGAPADRLLADADALPLVQTPMRWFWTPLRQGLEVVPGDTVVTTDAVGAFALHGVARATVAGTEQGWVLVGFGSLVGWEWVRYVAFPVVAHVAATVLYFVPFLMVQRVVTGIGRRVWNPPARGISATER